MTRVLWLTRHKPARAQMKSLRNIFGPVEVVQRAFTINSARDVIKLMRRENCSEVVVVLPLFTIAELVSAGIHPIISVMDKRRGKHKCFTKITKINLETQSLELAE